MTDSPTVQAIAEVPMFSGLSKRELKSIATWFRPLEYRPGQAVVNEGHSGIGFFVIVAGSARVEREGEFVSTLGIGDSFGETALLTGLGLRTASVIAETELDTYWMTAWNFDWMIRTYPQVGEAISRSLARRSADYARH